MHTHHMNILREIFGNDIPRSLLQFHSPKDASRYQLIQEYLRHGSMASFMPCFFNPKSFKGLPPPETITAPKKTDVLKQDDPAVPFFEMLPFLVRHSLLFQKTRQAFSLKTSAPPFVNDQPQLRTLAWRHSKRTRCTTSRRISEAIGPSNG